MDYKPLKLEIFLPNVLDLERSLLLCRDALGLKPVRTKGAADGCWLESIPER